MKPVTAIHSTLNSGLFSFSGALVLTLLLTTSPTVLAQQQLEEIIVTAQRRVQSLQEVPISIATVSASEIVKQGFREMEDIESFVPSVEIEANLHDTSITIRGMGNDVANLSVEQSAPMFVDGIAFGRASMIDIAFLDVERIEVLNGPQPISFGQNAVAGAFSVTSKKPTEEWEGDVAIEYGNFARFSVEGGVGGPINDTWGIRVAGQYDTTKGHLIDIFTGEAFPYKKEIVGRIITTWNPTENFQALFKVGYMNRISEGDPNVACVTTGAADLKYDETAILFRGEVPAWDAAHANQRQFPDCTDGFNRIGFKEGKETRERPVVGINAADGRNGIIDVSHLVRPFMAANGAPSTSLEAREPLKAWNFLINMNYEFDNGISIESNSGMVDYHRETYEDNEIDPFVTDSSSRVEQFDMWSQEIRVRSPSGGQLEWEAGVYYQTEALDLDPVITFRSNLREAIRLYHPWQDPVWKSAFANLTFNFFDDKASLDAGVRYTDVKKTGSITAQTATYIFDIDPDPNNDGLIQSTRYLAGNNSDTTIVRFNVGGEVPVNQSSGANAARNHYIIDCGDPLANVQQNTALRASTIGETTRSNVSPCGSYGAGFWTSAFDNRYVPDAWNAQRPVDVSPLMTGFTARPGPFLDTYSEDSFDPQIVLRYRPNDNISMYAKWVKAFKAGGFDTSDRGAPQGGIGTSLGQDEFSFLAEHATNYELGARGTAFDNTLRYGMTLFNQEIKDLQVETPIPDLATLLAGGESSGRGQINAGKQRTRGVDFDLTWLVNDNLVLNLAGVYQKGTMLDFVGGCTDTELLAAATGPCWTNAESEEILGAGNTALGGLIDRSGSRAPRTPDYKIILGVDYEHVIPGFESLKYQFSSKASVSDGYTEATLSYEEIIAWDTHYNINLNVGLASIDDTWQLNFWVRNLLDTREIYFLENDVNPQGIENPSIGANDYTTYGVQLGFQF